MISLSIQSLIGSMGRVKGAGSSAGATSAQAGTERGVSPDGRGLGATAGFIGGLT